MLFDYRPLFTFHLWFDTTPEPFLRSSEMVIMMLFGLWILAAIVFRFLSSRTRHDPPRHRLFRDLGRLCTIFGVFGWLLYWFSYERLPFLSMRFWYAAWAVANVVWGVMIVLRYLRTARKEREALRERQARAKYLP